MLKVSLGVTIPHPLLEEMSFTLSLFPPPLGLSLLAMMEANEVSQGCTTGEAVGVTGEKKKQKNKENEGEIGNVEGLKKKKSLTERLFFCVTDTADEPPSVRSQVLNSEMALKVSIFAVFLYWIQKKMRRSCNTSTLFISYWWFKDTACILDRSEKLMRKK